MPIIHSLEKHKYNFIVVTFREIKEKELDFLIELSKELPVNFVIVDISKDKGNKDISTESVEENIRKVKVFYRNILDFAKGIKRGLIFAATFTFKPFIIIYAGFSLKAIILGYLLKRWKGLKVFYHDISKQNKTFFETLIKNVKESVNIPNKGEKVENFRKILKEIKEKMEYIDGIKEKKLYDIEMESVKSEPVVSVVTPAFNASKFIENVAKCLNNQTIKDKIEWVVVDDFSSDNTAEFVKELAKKYNLSCSLLRNKENLGSAYSLKNGFKESKGKYLAWISADDFYISKDKLEKDLEILNNDPKSIVFSKYFIAYNCDRREFLKIKVPLEVYKSKIYGFEPNYLNGSSVVMKKQDYIDIGEIDEYFVNVDADYDLWLRFVVNDYKISFSETEVFNLVHGGNISLKRGLMEVGCSLSRSRGWRLKNMDNIKDKLNIHRWSLVISRYPFFIFDLVMLKVIDLPDEIWQEIRFLEPLYENYLKLLEKLLKTDSFLICLKRLKKERLERRG
ncbi:MAG: glycosyltransferase family A protein [Candidatus Methanomethylicia archaeon]